MKRQNITTRQLFFELLQVSVGQMDCLSRGPEPDEWKQLHALAVQHDVNGICYHGVEQLFAFGLRVPQDVALDWMSEAEDIRSHGQTVYDHSLTFQQKLSAEGIRSAVLSGPNISRCYGPVLQPLRTCHSVDIYTHCERVEAINVAKSLGHDRLIVNSECVCLHNWNDADVVLFYRFRCSRSSRRCERIRAWMQRNRSRLFAAGADGLTVPTLPVAAVLLTTLLYVQFVWRRMSIHALTDYFFVFRELGGAELRFEGGQTLPDVWRELGLSRFVGGASWLLRTVMGMPLNLLPAAPVEREGRFLLGELMHTQSSFRRVLYIMAHHPSELF